jgi:hypothetical protein
MHEDQQAGHNPDVRAGADGWISGPGLDVPGETPAGVPGEPPSAVQDSGRAAIAR